MSEALAPVLSVFDRERGGVFAERIFGEAALRFLYHGRGRPAVDWLLSHTVANMMYGWVQRSPQSRRKIPAFVSDLGIDAGEAEKELSAYRTLDEFFTRKLRPGARPIDDDPTHLVSPADGRALVYPVLDDGALVVKGSRVTLGELLGNEPLGERYRGGSALVVRLAPADYHRFHFPDSGVASPTRDLGRRLHSVHPIALSGGAPSFRNKRTVTSLTTRRFGELALVDVGALCVGTILQTYAPGPVRRGEEKGYFRFGGSTVVVLAEAGQVVFDEDLIQNSKEGIETLVKMGSRIGCHGINVPGGDVSDGADAPAGEPSGQRVTR